MTNQKYIPGVCNIGPAERKMRRTLGLIALAVTCLYVILVFIFHAKTFFRLFLFFPLFVSVLGLLQDQMHFCVEFGIMGVFNVMNKRGDKQTIENKEYLRQDKIKAAKIILYSFLIALSVALVVYIV